MENRLRSLIVAAVCTVAATPAIGSAQTWASWNLPGTCGAPVTGAFGAATVTYNGIYNGVQNANYVPNGSAPNPNALGCTVFGFNGFDSWALTPDGVYDGKPGNPANTKPSNPSFIQMVNEN